MFFIEKVHINWLNIIIGTKCNLTCKHCIGGSPKREEVLSIETVDKLIENITGIDTLFLLGYEVSLYCKKLREILDRFVTSSIKINKLSLVTNAAVYSKDLADIFNDFRYHHTAKPTEASWQFSPDKFHFNSGFTKEKYVDNKTKYKKVIGDDCHFIENDLIDGLVICGRAKSLESSDLEDVEKITIENTAQKFSSVGFREKCEGKQNTCNNGKCICNCILSPITLVPQGYIIVGDLMPFYCMGTNDYKTALGNINKESLYDMIQRDRRENRPNKQNIVFRDKNNAVWCVSYLIYRFIQIKREFRKILLNTKLDLATKQTAAIILLEGFKKIYSKMDIESKAQNVEAHRKFIDNTTNAIKTEFNYLYETIFYYWLIKNRLDELDKISAFTQKGLKLIGLDYDVFMRHWDAYEDCNFDIFKQTIDFFVKNETKEKMQQ